MLAVVFTFEDPHRLIDRDTPLNDGRVRRRREDATFLDVFVHAGSEVIGNDLDLVREFAFTQQLSGGFCGWRCPDNILDVGICLQILVG